MRGVFGRTGAVVALWVSLCAGLAGSAGAQEGSERMSGEGLGVMRVIFFHELGHALIDEFDLPTVGPEESVVDEFATYMLILTEAGDRRQIEALSSSIVFWINSAERFDGTPYGEHPPNARRGYAIACLLHGSDPGAFGDLLARLEIPASRARRCEQEYAEKRDKWLRLLGPHLNSTGRDAGAGLPVSYGPAKGRVDAVASLWRQARYLEGLAAEAQQLFALPRPIPVKGVSCGQPNAFWDGGAITLCYEMQLAIEGLLTGDGGGGAEPPSPPDRDRLSSEAAAPAPAGPQNINDLLGQ